jgi:acyl dehydratase
MGNDGYTYMEDCRIGQTFISGPITVTTEDIIAYARQYDPQPFHTDPDKAKETSFGGLVASGWQTASITMRLVIEAAPKMKGGMIGRSVLSMSWPLPVRPGDQLFYEGEILEMRPSASTPGRGILKLKNTTRNQNGESVMEMESIVFVPSRG